jgi:hypothetical protein
MTRRSYEAVLVPALLYAATFALLVATARAVGVTLHEPPRLAAATDAATLFSPAGKLVAVWATRLDGALARGNAPTILGGYLWAILARPPHAALDPLTALRLGAVALAAAIPPLVHTIARPWLGRSLALVAAALSVLGPRLLLDDATLAGDGPGVALALGAVAAYLASVERRAPWWGVAAAALLGLAAAVTTSTLLLAPAMFVHFALERRHASQRLARLGLVPMPIALVTLPVVGCLAFLIAQPFLLRQTGERLRDVAIRALSPSLGPVTWSGALPALDALPRTHATASLLCALTSVTAVLAVVGAIACGRLPLARFSDGGSRARLSALVVAGVTCWPLIAPNALLSFPSHGSLAVPFVALLAAFGAGVIARATHGDARRAAILAAPVGLALMASLPLSTLGAAFPTLAAGGVSGAARGSRMPLHDASLVAGLAAAIDAAGVDAAVVFSPDVPADVWDWMHRVGRLRTAVTTSPTEAGATLFVLSGDPRGRGGTVVAEVTRDGVPVLTLLKRLFSRRARAFRGDSGKIVALACVLKMKVTINNECTSASAAG